MFDRVQAALRAGGAGSSDFDLNPGAGPARVANCGRLRCFCR